MNKLLILIPILALLTGGVISYSAGEFVPTWIKNTAKWYGEGIISDQEYLDSIKFLIENNIITIDKIKEKVIIEPIILTPEKSFTDPRITQCDVLYPLYISQGQSQFQKQHSHINYIYDCMDIYEDKVWRYQGEDRLERIYNKFIEIHKQNIKLTSRDPIEPHTEVRSIVNIGTEKSMIKFDICAGDEPLDKAKVLVKSDIEVILIGSDKDIPENSCRNYEALIYAKYPEDIEIEIVERIVAKSE